MNNHTRFKDTTLESDQPIVFESDHVEFKVSKPTRNWKIAKINSAVVSNYYIYIVACSPREHHLLSCDIILCLAIPIKSLIAYT